MKKTLQYLLLFLVTVPFYAQTIPSYYNDLDLTKTGNELFLELSSRVISTHSGIPYTGSPVDVWDACKLADEDPQISENVLLIYGYNDSDGLVSTDRTRDKTLQDTGSGASGVWNREHVFAKSLAVPNFGTDEPGPGTDVHNLRPADRDRNSTRSNRPFTNGTGIASYTASDGGWYPGDEWKGDVARIVMYMYLRYHGNGTQISQTNCLPINVGYGTINNMDPNMVNLFLQWNVEDPVSDFEANRNDELAGIQMNRNPFIDNPYLATVIWGGLLADDKWWANNSSDTEAPTIPTNIVTSNITDESFDVSWDASTDNTSVYDYSVYIDGVYLQSSTTTSTSITNLSPDTSYIITVKSRDAASNYSEFSVPLNVTTLVGPTILIKEYFEDCTNTKFFAYNEDSDKNWECTSTFGENNSGSYGINGYEENVPSKDWLITNEPIDFDVETGEKLSFYAVEKYGITPLELLYSSDYDGVSLPINFTWTAVPNINIPVPIKADPEVDVVTVFSNIDISEISGTVYVAFKYYSDGVDATRWTVDSFEITADNDNPDTDGDGIDNADDLCPNTPTGETVNVDGCSNGQLDDDDDGVQNSLDVCADTPDGESVNSDGCAESQLDDDNDGIFNNVDICPNTPTGEVVNADGCSNGQLDDDTDGIQNSLDLCSDTPAGETVNSDGCGASQLDDDVDGVFNNIDKCPNTPAGESVNADGCSNGQLDDDDDGVQNSLDVCADTPVGESVNSDGCAESQLDDDNDGIFNNVDVCANTPTNEVVNSDGCGASQLDDDTDGVMNDKDLCANTPIGTLVDASGCFTLSSNNFAIEVVSEACPNKNNGEISITATASYTYTTTINGVNYTFDNNNGVTAINLPPNTYNICISVSGESYQQCYAVEVLEGSTVSGKSSVASGKASIEIEKGTVPFTIYVNGEESFTTNSTLFNVDVKHGDLVEVKTAVSCEGVFSKTIELLDGIIAYPNPSNGAFEISLPVTQKEVMIELYTIQSQLISVKTYPIVNGKVQLNIENQPIGMYIARVQLNSPITLKIIKQ